MVWLILAAGVQARAAAAAPARSAPVAVAVAASGPLAKPSGDPPLWGKAWLAPQSGHDSEPGQAWVWSAPSGRASAGAWTAAEPQGCASDMAGAAAIVLHLPRLLEAVCAGPDGARMRQVFFRLGLGTLGDARMQVQKGPTGQLVGQGALMWPAPRRGLSAALGPAQSTERPSIVPPGVAAYAAISVSPGRLWQELEALAGGVWPLEATVFGTQIAAWEQDSDHGLLPDDVLGFAATQLAVFAVPSARGVRLGFALPVQKPAAALDFLRWAVDVVGGFASRFQASTQVVQGHKLLVLRGLVSGAGGRPRRMYLACDSAQLLGATDAATLVGMLRRKPVAPPAALGPAGADTGAASPKTATAFGRLEHQAALRLAGYKAAGPPWLQRLGTAPTGRSFVWLDAAAQGFVWQTQSAP